MVVNWNSVKKYFSGKPDDLIEIYFEGLSEDSWRRLFTWLGQRPIHRVIDQNGVVWDNVMNLEDYLSERVSYLITFDNTQNRTLNLCINDLEYAEMSVEHSEVQCEEDFLRLLTDLRELAVVLQCPNYIMCPEFKKEQAFYKSSAFSH